MSEDFEPLAVAVLAGFDGSAPVMTGDSLYVGAGGETAGALAGGAIDAAVVRDALAAEGPGEIREYAISAELAQRAGLPCGGVAHVLIAPLGDPAPHEAARRAREERRAYALAYRIGGPVVYIDEDATVGAPDDEVVALARKLLSRGRDGEERLGEDVRIFARVPAPRMVILGAIDISVAVAEGAERLGYELTVVEPRPDRVAVGRFPAAAAVSAANPAAMIAETQLGPRDAVLIFTHDLSLDVPAVQAAFAGGAGYVGALGSRRTAAARREALAAAGVADTDIARLRAPCGLDVGASSPHESAVSILAEVLADRARRTPGHLSEATGSIRAV